MIPYSRQNISRQDIKSVIKTLKSDFLTQGPVVPKFETAVATYCGAKYGVATNSATSALHIALLSLDVRPGDLVWTSPNSFVASANSALYCGAKIDFVDIDAKTYNISTDALQEKLDLAEKSGTLPKVLIPVHFAGQSCEMDKIFKLSKKYGFRIVEDASHAIGGKYQEEPIGNCQFSDITVFSFHPVKIITTGEGGMALTNDVELSKKMQLFRSHGVERKPFVNEYPLDEIWNYQQVALGFNYRLTDFQAALGISQLKKIDDSIAKRHKISAYYKSKLTNLPLILPWQHPDSRSSYHLYPIRLDRKRTAISQKVIYEFLIQNKIGVNIHYIPIYRHPYFLKFGFNKSNYLNSEEYFKTTISLPMHPSLTKKQQRYTVKKVRAIFEL